MSPRDAIQLARDKNLDLVEVAPNANPPVCRIMDYGKFQYERTKKEREAKKGQKNIEIKEMRIRPKTAKYHIGFKLNRVRDFLSKGNKVKIRILFRAREITHAILARETFEEIAEDLADVATVEQAPLMDGKSLVMMLAPGPQKGGPSAARAAVRSARIRIPAPGEAAPASAAATAAATAAAAAAPNDESEAEDIEEVVEIDETTTPS